MKTALILFGLMAFTVGTTSCTVNTLRENIDEEWETFKVGAEKGIANKMNFIIVMFFFLFT